MEKRRLGRSVLEVPPLCFGGNVFGWTADRAMGFRLLDRLAEAGLTFIDTADVYSTWVPGHQGGESENMIGEWIAGRGRRDDLVIATKVGSPMGPGKEGLKAAYIERAIEDSLRRLRTDHVDLYQSHRDDASTPVEETLAAYGRLIEAGKVRVIGASNFTAGRLREALDASARDGLPRYESLQPEYNLYDRAGFEAELQPLCVEEEVGVITYFSLARGFLSGKYRSEADLGQSPRGNGIKPYLDARGMRILAALDAAAAEHGATPAQVSLAWLMAQPGITAAIASATTPAQLEDLIAATSLTLPSATLARLDAASAP